MTDHQYRKGDEVRSDKRLAQPLAVAHQATEAGHPAEAAFDYPTPGQQHEAVLGGRQLDYL